VLYCQVVEKYIQQLPSSDKAELLAHALEVASTSGMQSVPVTVEYMHHDENVCFLILMACGFFAPMCYLRHETNVTATEQYQATRHAAQSSNYSKLCWAGLFRRCARCHAGDQHCAGLHFCCQPPPRKLEGLLGFAVQLPTKVASLLTEPDFALQADMTTRPSQPAT